MPKLTEEDLSLYIGRLQREAMKCRTILRKYPLDPYALLKLSWVDRAAIAGVERYLDENY